MTDAPTPDAARPAHGSRVRGGALVVGSVALGIGVALALGPARGVDVAALFEGLDASATGRLVRGALAIVDQLVIRF